MPWRAIAASFILFVAVTLSSAQSQNSWLQWAGGPQHTGYAHLTGQPANRKLAQVRYDPFVAQEKLDAGGPLVVHYQVPLVEDQSVYMEFKTGKWVPCKHPRDWQRGIPCGPLEWNQEIWNERRLDWEQGALVEKWNFQSDWKPVPTSYSAPLENWEPVFHAVIAGDYVYLPGYGGTVWKVRKTDGKALAQISPMGGVIDQNVYVAGPLTADASGNIYYNALQLDPANPWFNDVVGSWLVKIAPDDTLTKVSFKDLTPNAPGPNGNCPLFFFTENTLPWPPSKTAMPIDVPCGSQRPVLNVAPAVAPDGTIYTVSAAHYWFTEAFLIAVNPDLTRKWSSTTARRFKDGCGVLIPIATYKNEPNACREDANFGVDPTTNTWGSGWEVDFGSSTPTVLPDGGILMGSLGLYDEARGHLMKFSSTGEYLGAYNFGWDETAAVYPHDGTYSIIIKDNHYPGGLYCQFRGNPVCKPLPEGPYNITQLNADLQIEWTFTNDTIDQTHPHGYEWCVNAAVVDENGTVYVNSEDGHLYVIGQGGELKSKIFLQNAIEAAYTPLSLGPDGKIYTQNNGVLFVVGK
jgi:hypothetical protein